MVIQSFVFHEHDNLFQYIWNLRYLKVDEKIAVTRVTSLLNPVYLYYTYLFCIDSVNRIFLFFFPPLVSITLGFLPLSWTLSSSNLWFFSFPQQLNVTVSWVSFFLFFFFLAYSLYCQIFSSVMAFCSLAWEFLQQER